MAVAGLGGTGTGIVGTGRAKNFPFATQFADGPFGRLAYFDQGQGEPLLFVHGLAGDFSHWLYVAPGLADGFRVIGLDLPGCGLSQSPQPASMFRYAESTFWLMRHLGVESAFLIGHSLGGAIAAELAMRRAEAVRGLILIDSAGFQHFPWYLRLTAPYMLQPYALAATLVTLGPFLLRLCFHRRNFRVRQFSRDALDRSPNLVAMARVFKELGVDLLHRHFVYDLWQLRTPVLLIWGEKDRVLPIRRVLPWMAQLPKHELRLIPDCGHMPIIEQPDETVRLCLEFLLHRMP